MEPTWWFIPNWNSPRSHCCLMKSLITSLTWGCYWEMSICNSLEHPSNSVLQFIDTDAAITSNILHLFLTCKTYRILHKNIYDTTFMLICFVFKKVKIRYRLEGSSRSVLLSGLWPLPSQYVVLVVILTSFTRSITSFNHTTNSDEKSIGAWAYFYWKCCWLLSWGFIQWHFSSSCLRQNGGCDSEPSFSSLKQDALLNNSKSNITEGLYYETHYIFIDY